MFNIPKTRTWVTRASRLNDFILLGMESVLLFYIVFICFPLEDCLREVKSGTLSYHFRFFSLEILSTPYSHVCGEHTDQFLSFLINKI